MANSNLSFVRHVGDGVTTQFAITAAGENMSYFRTSDIHVYVDDVEVAITIEVSSPHLVILAEAPALGADVLVRREMPVETPYADFERGNNFGHRQVNNTVLQQLYLTQEILDGFLPEGFYMKQDVSMGEHKITDLADGEEEGDGVNFGQLTETNDRVTDLEQSLTQGNLIYRRVTFTAEQGQTEFYPNATFGAVLNLYINGIHQIAGEAYELIGSSGIRTVALDEGDKVVAIIGQEPKFSEPEQVDLRYTRYPAYAVGGETELLVPIEFIQIMSVYINGVHQTMGVAWEADSLSNTVTFAEPLEGGDEIVFVIGNDPEESGAYATEAYVKSGDTRAQEELLPIGSKVYPDDGSYLKNGDNVTAGTTHLRVLVGGETAIVAMSPVTSGVVSLLSGTGATIGITPVYFSQIGKIEYSSDSNNSAVENMIAGYPVSLSIGQKASTGSGVWKGVDPSSTKGILLDNGNKAIPLNGIYLDDCGGDPTNTDFSDDALVLAKSLADEHGGASIIQSAGRYKFQDDFVFSGNAVHWKGAGPQATWNDYYGSGTFISGNGFRNSIKKMRIEDAGNTGQICIDEAYMKECVFEDVEITTPFGNEIGWLDTAIKAEGPATGEEGNFTNDYQRVRVVGASGWGMILGRNSNAVTSHKLSFARCGLGSLQIKRGNGLNLDLQLEGSASGKEVYIGDGAIVDGLRLEIYSELTNNISASRALRIEGTAQVEGLICNLNYVWGAVGGGYLGPDYGAELNTSGGGYCFGTINVGMVHGVQVSAVAANNSTDRVRVTGVRALTDFSTGTTLPLLDNKSSGASTSETLEIEGVRNNQSILLPLQTVQPPRIAIGSIWFSSQVTAPFISLDGVNRTRLQLQLGGTVRPSNPGKDEMFVDETLGANGKPIWHIGGGVWIDATGAIV